MKKISKEDIKNFWEEHKTEIIAGTVAVAGFIGTGLVLWKTSQKTSSDVVEDFGGLTIFRKEPSRPIPETELFKISDIAEDVNDGCVVWLDSCKLADCGKVGEELCKIARVTSDMVMPMVILGKDEP